MDRWREEYSPRNVTLLPVQPPDAADGPRQFIELEQRPDPALGGI
jgi:hypothetical protein